MGEFLFLCEQRRGRGSTRGDGTEQFRELGGHKRMCWVLGLALSSKPKHRTPPPAGPDLGPS